MHRLIPAAGRATAGASSGSRTRVLHLASASNRPLAGKVIEHLETFRHLARTCWRRLQTRAGMMKGRVSAGIASGGSSRRSCARRPFGTWLTWAVGRAPRWSPAAIREPIPRASDRPSQPAERPRRSLFEPPNRHHRPVHEKPPRVKSRRPNDLEPWAWVELNYRPHAYQDRGKLGQ